MDVRKSRYKIIELSIHCVYYLMIFLFYFPPFAWCLLCNKPASIRSLRNTHVPMEESSGGGRGDKFLMWDISDELSSSLLLIFRAESTQNCPQMTFLLLFTNGIVKHARKFFSVNISIINVNAIFPFPHTYVRVWLFDNNRFPNNRLQSIKTRNLEGDTHLTWHVYAIKAKWSKKLYRYKYWQAIVL